MSVLDFLFEGKPPKSVTTYGQTAKDVPKWMSDYTQGLIARANAVAAEDYIPYEGPRIAGFDPDQLAAFDETRRNIGSYEPFIEESAQRTARAGAMSPLAAASGYQDEASQRFPTSVDDYMSPYTENVLDRQAELSERQLNERFIPGLQKAFIGAGQFGSRGGEGTRSMEELGIRGVRDISENLQNQQQATLDQAYARANESFNADQARQLQLAQQQGQFATAEGELGLRGAQQLGALGEAYQQLGLRDAASLEAIGATQRELPQSSLDLAYGDFERQRDFPKDQIRFMSEVIRGLPPQGETIRTSQTGPGDNFQPSGLSQLAAAYGAYRGLAGDGNKRGGLIKAFPRKKKSPQYHIHHYREGGPVTIDGLYEVVANG